METLSASNAKREFGEVLIKAQRAPIRINKNGKPIAVMLSASVWAEVEEMKRLFLQQEIDKGIADIQAGRVSDGEDVHARLRRRVLNAKL